MLRVLLIPLVTLTLSFAAASSATAADDLDKWKTELDNDVASLTAEIKERVQVLDRIRLKINEIDGRIEILEANASARDNSAREEIKTLRSSRLRLAELHGAMTTNAEHALSLIQSYAEQLTDVIERTEG